MKTPKSTETDTSSGTSRISRATTITGSPSWDEQFGGGKNPFSKSITEVNSRMKKTIQRRTTK